MNSSARASGELSPCASVCILFEETEECIQWFCNTLVAMIPTLQNRVCTIVTDKGKKLRKCLKICFPEASCILCKFHVNQIFQRQITTNKMELSAYKRQEILICLQKMMHCDDYNEYLSYVSQLLHAFNNTKLSECYGINRNLFIVIGHGCPTLLY